MLSIRRVFLMRMGAALHPPSFQKTTRDTDIKSFAFIPLARDLAGGEGRNRGHVKLA